MPLPKENGRFTYHDYETWPDDERWELIDGVAYNMSPAPSLKHQDIAGNIYLALRNALDGKPCRVFVAPTDVLISEYDVVQPDVLVVCDPKKLTDKNVQGAPDLVIEVLSPATAKKDRWDKKRLYEKHGVREYILADPEGRYVERYLLGEDGLFDRGKVFDSKAELKLVSIETITIPLLDVFETDEPPS